MLEFVVCRTRIRRLLVYQTYQTSRGWTTICSHTYDLQQIHPTMASMNFSSSKQWVKPPQRGIFPLDHDRECKEYMETYLACLKREQQQHNKCRELSKDYLQCRMDRQLMAKEDLNNVRIRIYNLRLLF